MPTAVWNTTGDCSLHTQSVTRIMPSNRQQHTAFRGGHQRRDRCSQPIAHNRPKKPVSADQVFKHRMQPHYALIRHKQRYNAASTHETTHINETKRTRTLMRARNSSTAETGLDDSPPPLVRLLQRSCSRRRTSCSNTMKRSVRLRRASPRFASRPWEKIFFCQIRPSS